MRLASSLYASISQQALATKAGLAHASTAAWTVASLARWIAGASLLTPARSNKHVVSVGVKLSACAIRSSVCAETLIWRPCSSHVYHDRPTPASAATSSRRRPGVRRRLLPSPTPAADGEIDARRAI